MGLQVIKEYQEEDLTFVVNVPQEPSYDIAYYPKLSMTEWLIYVFSCLGSWFGVSMMGLNPFNSNWLKRLREKRRARNGASKQQSRKQAMPISRASAMKQSRQTTTRSALQPAARRKKRSNWASYRRSPPGRPSSADTCAYCLATRVMLRNEMRSEVDFLMSLLPNSKYGHVKYARPGSIYR